MRLLIWLAVIILWLALFFLGSFACMTIRERMLKKRGCHCGNCECFDDLSTDNDEAGEVNGYCSLMTVETGYGNWVNDQSVCGYWKADAKGEGNA